MYPPLGNTATFLQGIPKEELDAIAAELTQQLYEAEDHHSEHRQAELLRKIEQVQQRYESLTQPGSSSWEMEASLPSPRKTQLLRFYSLICYYMALNNRNYY